MVGQEPTLFASSIKDNIAYGCNATDYQVCSIYSTRTAFQSLLGRSISNRLIGRNDCNRLQNQKSVSRIKYKKLYI